MQTHSPPFGDFNTTKAKEERELFSHQTLLLTALTALNNPNNSPKLHDNLVKEERVEYMRQQTTRHTPVMDAVTTILITDKEIIATMARGIQTILAIKQDPIDTKQEAIDTEKLEAPQNDDFDLDLEGIETEERPDPASQKTVFLSFPNIDKKIVMSSINSSSTGSSCDHFCKPIAVDKGYWKEILNSGTGFIFESKKISFEAHVATVRDYLNWYKGIDRDTTEGSKLFSQYILSACWPKMKRRIGHWAAVGMMFNLMSVLDANLETQLKTTALPDHSIKRNDHRLSRYLIVLAENSNLMAILKNYEYKIPSLGHDLTKQKDVSVLPLLLQQCHESPHNIYKKETVVEFHHFFVATLLCYAKSLQDLYMEYEKKKTADKVIKKLVKSISDYQKRVEKKKDTPMKRRAPDSNTPMPTLKSSGTEADDCEERKEEKRKALESHLDGELTKALSSEGMEEKTTLPELRSCLSFSRMSNTTSSSPAEPMRNVDVMKTLELYLDRKLSSAWAPEEDHPINKKANAALSTCRILHSILLSAAFEDHIKFLVRLNCRVVAEDSIMALTTYRKFSEEHGLPWQQSNGDWADSEDKANEYDGEHDTDDSGCEETADEYGRDLERDQVPFGCGIDELHLAIQGWVKLFVQHFHAKSILENFARKVRGSVPIEIKVYGVSPPKNLPTMPKWTTLRTILETSLEGFPDKDKAEMMEMFSTSFGRNREGYHDDDSRDDDSRFSDRGKKIFRVVSDIVTGKSDDRPRYYNMHCEVALAGLVAASKISQGVPLSNYADTNLVDDLKALDPKDVAVSKLCCPACWVYFDILHKRQNLEGNEKMYNIRGRHSTVYPVQLPIWTSPDIVQELNKQFSQLLVEQLTNLRESRMAASSASKSGHRSSNSMESVLSAVTSVSKTTNSSNLDDLRETEFPNRPGLMATVDKGAPRTRRLLSVD